MAKSNILVNGDFLIDHHIYEGQRHHFGDPQSSGVCVKEELGGAALIHRLLNGIALLKSSDWTSRLAVKEPDFNSQSAACREGQTSCTDQAYSAYAFWRSHPKERDKTKRDDPKRWRVAEAMGFGGGGPVARRWPWELAVDGSETATVLVISDGGMGFRSRANARQWGMPLKDKRLNELAGEAAELYAQEAEGERDQPEKMNSETKWSEPTWIVLKMSSPIAEGDLWRELSANHGKNLVVIVSAHELRHAGIRVGSGVSWEQTLEDIHYGLTHDSRLKSLSLSRHLIIAFGCEAALWLDLENSDEPVARFVFDPGHMEGECLAEVRGDVYGMLSCLTSTVTESLVEAAPNGSPVDQTEFDTRIANALRDGLSMMRCLLTNGHGDADHPGTGFPVSVLADVLNIDSNENDSFLRQVTFKCDRSCPVKPGWSLLALHEANVIAGEAGNPLHGIARRVLTRGTQQLDAPFLQVGNFLTVDRNEIEALRGLRGLVEHYLEKRKVDKPLSIGVFGPPGAGKSFAVEEMAIEMIGDQLGWKVFNLSQFSGTDDLIGALHQIRDLQLEGKMPVAFFDEFDSQSYLWLKYLLAPMQDGSFQEGLINHPVGRCIMIFAGGTSDSFESFMAKGMFDENDQKEKRQQAEAFRLAKGPDFASRLDGRLNVVGPNARSDSDICFPVRRALFIRGNLKCELDERLTVASGLATALLEIPCYRHGARSLVKLLEPFITQRTRDKQSILTAAMLPPRDELNLYVDATEFDGLTRRDEEIANKLGIDKFASAVNEFYRELGREQGWIDGKPHLDQDFAQLSEFDKETNRAAARRIPTVLALVGLRLESTGSADHEPFDFGNLPPSQIDLMGEAEHDGWMDWHLINGWSLGDDRSDPSCIHHLLKPFVDLDPTEKVKDTDAVRNYPEIAERAGLKIVITNPATK